MRYLAAFHRANIAEREKTRGKKLDYEILVSDLFAVSKGVFVEYGKRAELSPSKITRIIRLNVLSFNLTYIEHTKFVSKITHFKSNF
jgi:hypothetical protein